VNPALVQVLVQAGFAGVLIFVLWIFYKLAQPFLAGMLASLNANTASLTGLAHKLDAQAAAILARVDSAEKSVLARVDSTERVLLAAVASASSGIVSDVSAEVHDRASTTTKEVVRAVREESRAATGSHPAITEELVDDPPSSDRGGRQPLVPQRDRAPRGQGSAPLRPRHG